MLKDDPMPVNATLPKRDIKPKQKPRRWAVTILEILVVLAGAVALFRYVTTGQILPALDAAKQYEWGGVYEKDGSTAKAIAAYTDAINLGYEPLAMAYLQRGRMEQIAKDYASALGDYTQAIDLDTLCESCSLAYYQRGQTYQRLENYEAARADFKQATVVMPRYLAAYVALAQLETLQGHLTQALIDIQTGFKAVAKDTVERGIAAGQQRSIHFEAEGQQYHLSLTANEGDDLTATLIRPTLDVVMLLEDAAGTPLAYASMRKDQADILHYAVETTGDYTLVIAAYTPSSIGEITLALTSSSAPVTSTAAATPRIGLENAAQLTVADSLKGQASQLKTFAANGAFYLEKAANQLILYNLTTTPVGYNSIDIGSDYVWAIAVSADGERAAVGTDTYLLLYDGVTGTVEQSLRLNNASPAALAFSPDSAAIAIVLDKEVRVYDVMGGSLMHTLALGEGYGQSLTYSRDGRWLAVGLDKGQIQIWDVEHTMLIRTLETGKMEEISALAFSPNATVIAAGGEARRVQVWDVSSGELLQTYADHTRKITDIVFSPNGRLLASASQDQTVRLWDIEMPKAIATLSHQDAVQAVEFQADGRGLLSAADDGLLRFWRVKE